MDVIDLSQYKKIPGRKSYSVRSDGTEFETYYHKETQEEVFVQRGTNKIISWVIVEKRDSNREIPVISMLPVGIRDSKK